MMEKNVVINMIIFLMLNYSLGVAQKNEKFTINEVMTDSAFSFSDHQFNSSVLDEKQLNEFSINRKAVFSKLADKYKDIDRTHGILLAEGLWGGAFIKSSATIDLDNKQIQITFLDFNSRIQVEIDSTNMVKASEIPNEDVIKGFSGEVIGYNDPVNYNECYVFLKNDIIKEISHPNFSYKRMNRIIEGYMLLVRRKKYSSENRAFLVLFRSFVDIKDIDEWKLEQKQR
ncbi:MAG: hypothetical protein ACPGJS_00030 [Flammeovirgaceae bacterium]